MINVDQQALLELLKASLFGVDPVFPEGVDWDAVLQEAKDQTVVALAAPAVPKEEAAKWQVPVAQNKMRFFQILDEQTKLVKLFNDASIPMVILKGCAAAQYYPVPMQRTMGDIDFIVSPEQFDEACQIMDNNGYLYICDHRDDRDYCYIKGGIVFELHHRYSDKDWDIEPLIIKGISSAETHEMYGKTYLAMPSDTNGLILLDHIRHHLYRGLGIRQIIDWMMYLHSIQNDDKWESRFLPFVEDAGLEKLAVTVTKMCYLWFGLPDRLNWCENADDSLVQELLEDVFDSGNFGKKSSEEDLTVESISMNIRRQGLFRYLQSTGLLKWKACQRHKILRPFAWLYLLFRYTFKGVAAMFRGVRVVKDIGAGQKRTDFNKRLGIEK